MSQNVSPALEDELVSSLRRIIRGLDQHSRRLFDQCGLTGPQLAMLQEAARRSGAPAGAIAKALTLSQPTVTGILDRLERQGLVRRTRSSADRRSVLVTVTEQGFTVLNQAPPLLQERFREAFRKLPQWQQTHMLATLQQISSMMQPQADERVREDVAVASVV